MMGERSAQDRLFAADHIYLDYVGRDTLYGYLAQHRGQLFRDEDFAILYCRNNGRPSVPPSLAVSILFLRAYDSVSFVEAIGSWAEKEGLHRYFGSSLKGEAAIDWNDKTQREQLLTQIVEDGRRLLSLAEQARHEHPEHEETI